MRRILKVFLPVGLVLVVCFYACGEPGIRPGADGEDASRRFLQKHRPQFHFTPSEAWMNDPNGMFYLDGEYHMSYQYYPDSTVWGPMHWGHAVSKDLVRWEHLPIALYPDSLGYIFSGSAVVDRENTSGFGTGESPPVVAAFTHHDPEGEKAGSDNFQAQSLAYSLDKGRSWQKFEGNPVLPNNTGIRDFRDPKLVWHEESGKWIMALAVYDRVQFYGSEDLKEWAYLSEFGIKGDTRLWECPDLFPIRVSGTRELKWVLIVSIQQEGPTGGTGTSYFVGDFDGTTFSADPGDQKWLDYGADNYAFVTWDNAPVGWGQRLGIGWMSNWQYAQEVPTETWRSAMTVPRVLDLAQRDDAYILRARPVPSLTGLRDAEIRLDTAIGERTELSGSFTPSRCELDLSVDLRRSTARSFGFTLSNPKGEKLLIRFDRDKGQLEVDRSQSGPQGFSDVFFEGPHTAPLVMDQEELDIRVLLDVASVEIFADKGALNFTEIFFPDTPYSKLEIWVEGGDLNLLEGSVFGLKSIWETAP